MRKIILNMAISLDGLIEGENGKYDWCFTDMDYGMKNFLDNTDSIIFGRKSYEILMKTEKDPYPDKMKYVISRKLRLDKPNTVVISEMGRKIIELKTAPGKDIWFYGGAELFSNFLEKGLIDEIQLSVHPIILGKGKSLYFNVKNRSDWVLVKSLAYDSGLIQLHYIRNIEHN